MLRYRRGASGRTQEGNHTMQHKNLTISTPQREAAFVSCARLRPRATARPATEKKAGPRLFED